MAVDSHDRNSLCFFSLAPPRYYSFNMRMTHQKHEPLEMIDRITNTSTDSRS